MKNQELLLKAIQKKVQNKSLLDEIAKVLGISYDAAHRRLSLKSKFTIDETILLCQQFNIAMDLLFKKENKYVLDKTKTIKSIADFKSYLEKSASILNQYKGNGSSVYYSAKDIPLHYTLGGSLLSKFKLYVWLAILSPEEDLSFENFVMEDLILQDSIRLVTIFQNIHRVEIWNDTTINSSLQQLYYFYEAGLLKYSNALLIIDDIKNIILKVEQEIYNTTSSFELFHNEILLLNNTVLFTNETHASFFIPHNMLSYYVTSDAQICQEEKEFITNQLKNSMSISKAGRKDQKIFFTKMYQKIEFYRNKIENYIME
ncbi:conserved hypothetical protein [Flavobacterium sp. 9AF]|uniref:hypothetical protein n=1 Tax=Flavobacterium sp. 9AF TaxID=2653142 RepID=UPI0012F138A8|nr:hypothetical protein [Flavobacterium sp. 9AF]VXB07575.1 conserved hypothetical protein [Flavobacterium sp. 9AF]